MLKIRLQRTGKRRDPSFRIVVAEHTQSATAGKFVERVGSYNPKTKERILNNERINHWISVGAQPSPTVHNMLVSANVISGKKINVLPKKTVPKKEGEAQAESAPVAEEATAEAPEAATEAESAPEEKKEEVAA